MSGLICAGDLYFDRFDDAGNPTGLVDFGNATKLAIQEQSDIKERPSKRRETYGQALDATPIKKPATGEMTIDEIGSDQLALAFMASSSSLTAASGTVSTGSPESTVAKSGKWVPLAHGDISSLVLKSTDGSPVTYVSGTDYEVHARLGWYRALEGGDIIDGEALAASYSYGAATGTRLVGGAKPVIQGRMVLDGKNLATGKDILVTVFDGLWTPKSAVDFFSDNYLPIEMSGTLRTPVDQEGPYVVDLK